MMVELAQLAKKYSSLPMVLEALLQMPLVFILEVIATLIF